MLGRALLPLSAEVLAIVVARSLRAQGKTPFKPDELDQMMAPIALYPDSLFSQVQMTATYPLGVGATRRFNTFNPDKERQKSEMTP